MHKRLIETAITLVFLLCLSFTCFHVQNNPSDNSSSVVTDSVQSTDSGDVSILDNDNNIQSGQNAPDDMDSTENLDSTEESIDTEESTDIEEGVDTENNVDQNESVDTEDSINNDDNKDSTADTTDEPAFEPCSGTRYVSAYALNVRSGPSTDADVIGQLYINYQVELIARYETGFYEIKCGDLHGFVSQNYLSETETIIQNETKPATPPPSSNHDSIANLQERVASIAANNQGTKPCTSGYCARWVSGIYEAAGLGYPGGNAIDYWNNWHWSGSTDMTNIPIGAVVVGSGSGSEMGNLYGHVGIYIGNGMVADNPGYHRIISLEEWAVKQRGYCQGHHGYIGWVWPYGESLGDLTY